MICQENCTFKIKELAAPKFKQTQKILTACEDLFSTYYTVTNKEACYKNQDSLCCERIYLTCNNLGVPHKNTVGIHPEEEILICCNDQELQIYLLRQDFPRIPHTTFYKTEFPLGLCLYDTPWELVERDWTAEQFLKRILLWFKNAAQGSLHQEDQPLEHLFFNSYYTLYLPQDFYQNLERGDIEFFIGRFEENKHLFRGGFIPRDRKFAEGRKSPVLIIDLPTTIHSSTATQSHIVSLADLISYFDKIKINFMSLLKEKLISIIPPEGVQLTDDFTFLICHAPMQRDTINQNAETVHTYAYLLASDTTKIGVALGLFSEHAGKFFHIPSIGIPKETYSSSSRMQDIKILPLTTKFPATREEARQASAITNYKDFSGVLAGLGTLGSALANIWSRQGWGKWAYIDPDIVEPHNIARHIATMDNVGESKVFAVARHTALHFGVYPENQLQDNVTNMSNDEVRHAVTSYQLLVDATTSIPASRDLAVQDNVTRCVSVFLSPNGYDAVMLFEDISRLSRLDILEYQYYQYLISSGLGDTHLTNQPKNIRYGTSCSDTSFVIPYDIVNLHAGNLAYQVRRYSQKSDAKIKIYQYEDSSGAIKVYDVAVQPFKRTKHNNWEIIISDSLIAKTKELRKNNLPKETGGVLLGYWDFKTFKIYIVDAMPQPVDSLATPQYFERGYQDLKEQVQAVADKTAGMVKYIGEWHSHPQGCSPMPSNLDNVLFSNLKEKMEEDGLPFVMLIQGECDYQIIFQKIYE